MPMPCRPRLRYARPEPGDVAIRSQDVELGWRSRSPSVGDQSSSRLVGNCGAIHWTRRYFDQHSEQVGERHRFDKEAIEASLIRSCSGRLGCKGSESDQCHRLELGVSPESASDLKAIDIG